MAKKCDNCLRGAQIKTTGTHPKDSTLKMDMGGAVLYVMPRPNGNIEVHLNSESLDGEYSVCIWNGDGWIVSSG